MGWLDVVLLLAILGIVVLALLGLRKRRKNGCGCGCADCPSKCPKRKQ